jgi:hypothetical protein
MPEVKNGRIAGNFIGNSVEDLHGKFSNRKTSLEL